MAVLVTGGAGYVGSHIVHALMDAGEEAVVIDDLSTGSAGNLPTATVFYKADAGDRTAVFAILRRHAIREVIHLAGSISVPESMAQPLDYWRNNVGTAQGLFEACTAARVASIVFSSTAAVYGEPASGAVGEDAPLRPTSPYGHTKLAVEWMLADVARRFGISYAALRYFNVAGADPSGRTGPANPLGQGLFQSVARAVTHDRAVTVYGADFPTPDGTGVRDYVHVSDLAAAHLSALARLRTGAKSFTLNCGYGRGASVREVIAAFETASGKRLGVTLAPRRIGDLAAVVADARRIREELDWSPQYDGLVVMAQTSLAWERSRSRRDASRKSKAPRARAAV